MKIIEIINKWIKENIKEEKEKLYSKIRWELIKPEELFEIYYKDQFIKENEYIKYLEINLKKENKLNQRGMLFNNSNILDIESQNFLKINLPNYLISKKFQLIYNSLDYNYGLFQNFINCVQNRINLFVFVKTKNNDSFGLFTKLSYSFIFIKD
jgi:hypothetical protein